jgi:HEAT repeat protein
LILLWGLTPPLFTQESILASYERNFTRASLATKAGILRDAATDDRSAEFIGELYEFALRFVLDNGELLREDPDMIALAGIAARGAGSSGYKPSADTLWKLFSVYRDSHSRVEILGALGILGRGNTQVVENLNQFLANQNNYFRSGMIPDYPALTACVAALGSLGDGSSFPVLFSAMTAGYPQALVQETIKALESLQGNYKQYLIDVIRKNPPTEKLAAFQIGITNQKFTEADQGELAETALEITLDLFPDNAGSGAAVSSLRFAAVEALTRLKWVRASPLTIRHFYRVQTDYSSGAASREQLLEAIACLGGMGTSEAAQVLALQLGYFNSQTERNGEYDEAVIMALVQALGFIGDKVAFDYLLYIGYLNYPEQIQAAAREALNRLKW